MIVIRLTGDQYLDQCFNMSRLKSRSGGSTPPDRDTFITGYSKYFDPVSKNYALGCIDNGELVSWIAVGFVDAPEKYWGITGLYTSKFVQLFSFNNPEIGLLIKEAFRIAEENHYYEYYYCVSKRISKVYEKQIQKTTFIPIGRYDYLEIAVIPAGTQPDNKLYWGLMGQEIKPDDIIIKKRILRLEHR